MTLPTRPEGALIAAAADASPIPIDMLAPSGGLLIIAPHPDDETLGCGEALAAASEAGREIGLILLTDGEGSHRNSKTYERDALVRLRREELGSALAILAPHRNIPVMRAGLRDGRSSIDQLGLHRLQRIVAFGASIDASAIWTTWEGDPHCDHKTAAELGRSLAKELNARLWRYPVWGRFGHQGQVPANLRQSTDRRFADRKRSAIATYRSQTTFLIDDDPEGASIPREILDHFADHPEIFISG